MKQKFAINQNWKSRQLKNNIQKSYNINDNLRVDKILSMVKSGGVFLDIGGGSGVLGSQLRNKFKLIISSDLSIIPLVIAKNNNLEAINHDFSLSNLPFTDNSINTITLLSVIQYLIDPESSINEIKRVLTDGGTFFIVSPNIRASWRLYKLIIKGEFPKTCFDPFGWDGGAIHYFCSKDIEILLRNNGFKIINKVGVKYIPSFFEVFEKFPIINNFVKEFFSAEFLIEAKKI